MSPLARVGGVNWIGDKTRQFSVVLDMFETEQLQIYGNWVETRQNSVHAAFRDRTKLCCFVANLVHTADTGKTRQDSFVLFVSATWNRHNSIIIHTPCRVRNIVAFIISELQQSRACAVNYGQNTLTLLFLLLSPTQSDVTLALWMHETKRTKAVCWTDMFI